MTRATSHVDTYVLDHLPPREEWPTFVFDLPALRYPSLLNCGAKLIDVAAERTPDRVAIRQGRRHWTYARLATETNQRAHALVRLGIVPGSRVLLRGGNSPELFAAWLAVMKVGAIAVTTMPMLRTTELKSIIEKASVTLALCESSLVEALQALLGTSSLARIVTYGHSSEELERESAGMSANFLAVETRQDDVCLIAFTSGTTGPPKAAVHFHRDVMAMCDTFAAHFLQPIENAVFSGTPPIAFTFGLGALLVFPLYCNATIALPDESTPASLARAIEDMNVTHLFTSPTAYRTLLAKFSASNLRSLRVCVSAGEHLPETVSEAWFAATGIRLIDGIGSTEMIHIFLSSSGEDVRPGSVGKPVPGFIARLIGDDGQPIEGAGTGRLAVRGPTGCLYLHDERQRSYVIDGWNITGDIFRRDEDGYYWYVARSDDMIVSSGYNISGAEVEAALYEHPCVAECAVIGWPDLDRGQIVKAVIVVNGGVDPSRELAKDLQEHVKRTLAPYKYPRAIEFRNALPKTATGKISRSSLRNEYLKSSNT